MFTAKSIVPALVVVCLLGLQAAVPSASAASSPLRAIVAAQPVAGARMIHLNLANSTTNAMELKIGETPVTLAAGETIKVTAPAGAKIVLTAAVGERATGEVLAEVTNYLAGATIRLN